MKFTKNLFPPLSSEVVSDSQKELDWKEVGSFPSHVKEDLMFL